MKEQPLAVETQHHAGKHTHPGASTSWFNSRRLHFPVLKPSLTRRSIMRLLHKRTIIALDGCGDVYIGLPHRSQTLIEVRSSGGNSSSIEIDHRHLEMDEHLRACAQLARQVAIAMGTVEAQPTSGIKFSLRVRKTMMRYGINTVGDLTAKTADELLECRNFGTESLQEVRAKLAGIGLSLRGE